MYVCMYIVSALGGGSGKGGRALFSIIVAEAWAVVRGRGRQSIYATPAGECGSSTEMAMVMNLEPDAFIISVRIAS